MPDRIRRAALLLAMAALVPAPAVADEGAPPAGEAGMKATLALAGPSEPGTRLIVKGVVRDAEGAAVAGAELVVYQTDARGWYTADKVMDEPHARLKGRVTTGPDGAFEIRTIRPGPYPATEATPESRRIPEHVHINVSAPGFTGRRIQMVFRDDPRMTSYWHEWARRAGHPVVDVRRGEDGSQRADLEIVLRKR